MVIEKCEICSAEFDPQMATHPRGGPACVSGLKREVESLRGRVEHFQRIYDEFSAEKNQKDESIIAGFQGIRSMIDAQTARIDNLAKRVNLVEHPNLKKVPSMPRD